MFSKEISFNEVPKAVAHLIDKVEKIELLLETEKPQPEPENCWLNLRELRAYHPDKPAAATVYAWVVGFTFRNPQTDYSVNSECRERIVQPVYFLPS